MATPKWTTVDAVPDADVQFNFIYVHLPGAHVLAFTCQVAAPLELIQESCTIPLDSGEYPARQCAVQLFPGDRYEEHSYMGVDVLRKVAGS